MNVQKVAWVAFMNLMEYIQNNALICVLRIKVAPQSNGLPLSQILTLVHVMESPMRFYIHILSAKQWLILVSTINWRIKKSFQKKRWQTTRKKLNWTKPELRSLNNKLKLRLWKINLVAILLLFWFDQINSYFNQIIKIKPNI